MNMYVSNLGFHVREDDLRQLFSGFGDVTSAKVIIDRETGKSRGFGFVEMKTDEDASNAMTSLNGRELEGRAITISPARQKENTTRHKVW